MSYLSPFPSSNLPSLLTHLFVLNPKLKITKFGLKKLETWLYHAETRSHKSASSLRLVTDWID